MTKQSAKAAAVLALQDSSAEHNQGNSGEPGSLATSKLPSGIAASPARSLSTPAAMQQQPLLQKGRRLSKR